MVLTMDEQRHFVREHCQKASQRYDDFVNEGASHLATELWKYCSLSTDLNVATVAYLDLSSPLLVDDVKSVFDWQTSKAILSSSYEPSTVHGTLIILQRKHTIVAKQMLQVLAETPMKRLQQKTLLLPKLLYALLARQLETNNLLPGRHVDWVFLDQTCHISALHFDNEQDSKSGWADDKSYRASHACPLDGDYCCSVKDTTQQQVHMMMNQHPIHPVQRTDFVQTLPLNAVGYVWNQSDELPYITTIQDPNESRRKKHVATTNKFDDLLRNNCLPSEECNTCLAKNGGCDTCADECSCYCKTLCREITPSNNSNKRLVSRPPLFQRDPNRFIPRIVHQFWPEPLTSEDYPDSSRMVESFRMSRWDHRIYTSDDAQEFLKTHFPSEVILAYDTLASESLKSLLFRYCVVFIHGGVFADIHVLLESNLDQSIQPDFGFVAPMAEPSGSSCLSTSFFAASPGHPFLAQTIETLVNQVRNRFSLIDLDLSYCPSPNLFWHRFEKTSFLAGPCLFGTSVNRASGRSRLTPFEAGEIKSGNSKALGRNVILHQQGEDMGGNRFTLTSKNLIVAVADIRPSEEADERTEMDEDMDIRGRFELDSLYEATEAANENIHIHVEMDRRPI
jgi:hypothetical protein